MRNSTRIWINGANGQVGKAILSALDCTEYEVITSDTDIDVTDLSQVTSFCDINYPDVIIHCAASSNIDSNNNVESTYKVNTLGARNTAIAARRVNAKIIYLSTDDVFDGSAGHPLNEFDFPNPNTVYGKSKLAGEQFVKELCPKHLIVRSSWIYGDSVNNFAYKIISDAKSGKQIQAAINELSSPTSAKALADFIIELIDTTEYGIYHASCEGVCSRFEFAQALLKRVGIEYEVTPIVSEKPVNTMLDNLMMRMTGIYSMPNWEKALDDFLAERSLLNEK